MILFPDRKAKSLGLNSKMYRSSSNHPETNDKNDEIIRIKVTKPTDMLLKWNMTGPIKIEYVPMNYNDRSLRRHWCKMIGILEDIGI